MALDLFEVLPDTFIQESLATRTLYKNIDALYELDNEVRLALLDLFRLSKLKLFNGIVYAFGYNGDGELGTGNIDNEKIPTPNDFSTITDRDGRKKSVIQVSAGGEHSLFLCEDGTVYSCGKGSRGRLGTGYTDSLAIPTKINTTNIGGKRVIQVSAGQNHSLFLCEDGSVYSCGSNIYSQLGTGNTHDKLIPTPINTLNIGQKRVIQVSAGSKHSLVLCEDGTVYSFGNGKSGKLGTGNTYDKLIPTKINTLNIGQKRVIQVSAGGAHSLILCEDGTVYSFGDNSLDQLGTGNTDNVAIPAKINTSNMIGKNKKVIQISAGDAHSLILREDGTVYSFGYSRWGQLGTGNTDNVRIPTQIDTSNTDEKRVIQVSAGGRHSLILCEDSTVYSCGQVSFGRLGTGNTKDALIPTPTPINTSLLDGEVVIDISAGGSHSLLLT